MKSSIHTALSAPALALALLFTAGTARAQRPRTVGDSAPAASAPAIVKVKYEGGMLGYPKADGFLALDEENRRLVFQDKTRREVFSLSFDAVLAAWPDTKSQTSTTGRVLAGTVPYGLGLPGLLMKSKTRYLVVQYSDPDTNANGVTSFKFGGKELLASFLQTLAQKAELTQRGEAYVRRKDAAKSTP
jgi:hypothetical protein